MTVVECQLATIFELALTELRYWRYDSERELWFREGDERRGFSMQEFALRLARAVYRVPAQAYVDRVCGDYSPPFSSN